MDSFTSKIRTSPARMQQRETASRPSNDEPGQGQGRDGNGNGNGRLAQDPIFPDLMPRPDFSRVANATNLAERRQQAALTPVLIGENKFITRKIEIHRPELEPIPYAVSPLSPRDMYESSDSKVTRDDDPFLASPSKPEPLRLRGDAQHQDVAASADADAMERYDAWVQNLPNVPQKRAHQPRRSKSTLEGHSHSHSDNFSHPSCSPQKWANASFGTDSPPFSPFPFYFREKDVAVAKRGGKKMIGEGGWLGQTDNPEDKPTSAAKKPGILDGIKKMAKDITEFHAGKRAKKPASAQMAVSLDAREQSLLYCELEYHLTNSINGFVAGELGKGRLDTDKLKKVGDAWLQQGRPKVVGFRYDLETQLELISLHIDDFAFHGRRQGNPSEIAGLLAAMKTNARAMRIRTFCQPDAVIAKQLVDAQSLFHLLGVGYKENQALAEIGQFFNDCMGGEEQTNK